MERYDAWTDFAEEPGRHHETYEGARRLLPELSIVGWLRFSKAFGHALEPDAHTGEFEIHCIVNGVLHWWVEDTTYELHSGMVLVIKPGELHGSSTGVLEPCEHYWLRIAFPEKAALPGLTARQTAALRKDFLALERRALPLSPTIREAFSSIIEEHRNRSDHSELISRSALHVLLASIARDYKRTDEAMGKKTSTISPYIQKSMRMIHESLEKPPSVSQMATAANMSETAFRKRFKKEVGCSPLDYITRRRVQEANALMARGEQTITEIAHALGFSSSQYFATVFKRITGVSPSRFQ